MLIVETQLLFLVSDLFIAGGETTITTLRWAILCLAIYTESQEKIREEIMNNIGPSSTPSSVHFRQSSTNNYIYSTKIGFYL